MPHQAIALFRSAFGGPPTQAASAPGRINLIGDHTDYNGGPVLPMALLERTTAVTGPGEAGWLGLVSTRDGRVERVRWDGPLPSGWSAYVVGVMRELARHGAAPPGADLALTSDVPIGAGLASSAALTVAAAAALAALSGAALPADVLVEVAHRAEYEHAGVRCGIMDQTIAVHARAGQALLLECATGRSRRIAVRGRVIRVDTGTSHELAASAYNARRAECESALARLARAEPGLRHLADWPPSRIRELRRRLPAPLWARAMHVVTETQRTRTAAAFLARGRWREFGRLMNASHDSLRRWYDCSAPPLDLVVRAARRAGAWGARLTARGGVEPSSSSLGRRGGGRRVAKHGLFGPSTDRSVARTDEHRQ